MNWDPQDDPWNAVEPARRSGEPQPDLLLQSAPSAPPQSPITPPGYRARLVAAWLVIIAAMLVVAALVFFADQLGVADSAEMSSSANTIDLTARSSELAFVLGLITLFFLGCFCIGTVWLIILIVLLSKGDLRAHYQPKPAGHSTAYLEAFAIFLPGLLVFQFIGMLATYLTGIPLTPVTLILAALPMFWPLVCGVSFKQFREDMGWVAPRGILREIGAGIAGYLAGLPILGVGLLITSLLVKLTGMQADHPIHEEMQGVGVGTIVMLALMAVVWAPLVEESVFRGALYRHMRHTPGWLNWLIASSANAFIFAAIHPQGLAGIPVLMSIALVLCCMRELRSSLIASITAHAINNGMVVGLLLIVFYA